MSCLAKDYATIFRLTLANCIRIIGIKGKTRSHTFFFAICFFPLKHLDISAALNDAFINWWLRVVLTLSRLGCLCDFYHHFPQQETLDSLTVDFVGFLQLETSKPFSTCVEFSSLAFSSVFSLSFSLSSGSQFSLSPYPLLQCDGVEDSFNCIKHMSRNQPGKFQYLLQINLYPSSLPDRH